MKKNQGDVLGREFAPGDIQALQHEGKVASGGAEEVIGDAKSHHEWGFQPFSRMAGVKKGPVIVGSLITAHPVKDR
jgi:hypothetical protein